MGPRKDPHCLCCVVDVAHQALYRELKFPTPTAAANDASQNAMQRVNSSSGGGVVANNNDAPSLVNLSQGSNASAAGSNSTSKSNAKAEKAQLSAEKAGLQGSVCKILEDTGFERCVVVISSTPRPYGTPSEHKDKRQIAGAIVVLTNEMIRQLHARGVLGDFLRDGLRNITLKYHTFKPTTTTTTTTTTTSDNVDAVQHLRRALSPKIILVIEGSGTAAHASRRTDQDFRILADLLVLQRAIGVAHISFCAGVRDVAAHVTGFADYVSNKATQRGGPVVATRMRDDTDNVLDPTMDGKVDRVDYQKAYEQFLLQIDGVTERRARAVRLVFPTLACLLGAINRKDSDALGRLADSRVFEAGTGATGGGGSKKKGAEMRFGDALVQRIVRYMEGCFSESLIVSETVRSLYEAEHAPAAGAAQ